MGSGPVGDIENHQAEQGEPWPPRIPCPRGQTSSIRPAGSRDRTGPPVQTSRCSVKMRAQKEGIEKGKGLRLGAWNSVAGGAAYVFWDQGMYGFAAARIAPRIPMRPPIVPGWPP